MTDYQIKIYRLFMFFLKKHDFDFCDRANKLLHRSFEREEEEQWKRLENE